MFDGERTSLVESHGLVLVITVYDTDEIGLTMDKSASICVMYHRM
jgi:hypothetical protein